jgi:hypothetical protein
MKTKIMWNHLDYSDQLQAMQAIEKMITDTQESILKTALQAAVIELELWSNHPCLNIVPIIREEEEELNDEDIIEIGTIKWIH